MVGLEVGLFIGVGGGYIRFGMVIVNELHVGFWVTFHCSSLGLLSLGN
jgi:hypothetical protein